RGADERVTELAPRMNAGVGAARDRDVRIIPAPSETMSYYADAPARRRMLDLPDVELPPLVDHPDPPLPIDDSDGGSDTGETSWYPAWSRQHPAIEIENEDAISDHGPEIYSLFRQRGIQNVLIMGVHTNMGVLKRSFGIKNLVR